MRVVKVYKEKVSLSTRINCRWRWAISAANETPMDQEASSLDWGWKCLGVDFTVSQIWQEEETRSMALSTSRAKKYPLKRCFVWYLDG